MAEVVKKKLKVPKLTALSVENAHVLLRTQGFVEPDVVYVESYEPQNTVVQQEPSRGQIIDSDQRITLRVSQRNLIRFLPGIFQRDESAQVLKGLLWVIQHQLESVNHKIDGIHNYFDPHEAPEEFLEWLAGWVAFTLDENWPEEKKRKLIKKAMDFYRLRGTPRGLQLYLKLFTGHEPEIIENQWPFRGFQIGINSTIGVDSVILPPVNLAHCFIVDFPIAPSEIDDETIIKIHDIIRAQKPAHTTYFLRFSGEKKLLSEFGIVIGETAIGLEEEIVQVGEFEESAYATSMDNE